MPQDVATTLPLALDLTSLGVDLEPLGLDIVGFVVADRAGTPLQVQAGGQANLALELDLSDPESLGSFLLAGTGVELDIRAVRDDLSFSTPLCALAANVNGGKFWLDADGAGPGSEAVQLQAHLETGARLPFDAAAAASTLTALGVIDIDLPLEFLGASQTPLKVKVGDLANVNTTSTVSGPNVANLQAGLDLRENLNALRLGFPRLFEELDRALDNEAFSQPLPLVGTQLAVAADFIDQLVAKVSDNLAGSTETLVPERLRNALFEALGPDGHRWLQDLDANLTVNVDDVLVSSSADEVRFELNLAQSLALLDLPVDLDLALPNLDLKISDASPNVKLGFELPLAFGISKTHGVFLDVADGQGDPLQLNVGLEVDPLEIWPADGVLGGLLPFTVTEKVHDNEPTYLTGAYTIDFASSDGPTRRRLIDLIQDNHQISATFAGEADVNLKLETALPDVMIDGKTIHNAAFPRFQMDLDIDWSFNTTDPAVGDSTPGVLFDNVQFELVSFMRDFVGPVVERMDRAFEPLDAFLKTALVLTGEGWSSDIASEGWSKAVGIGLSLLTMLPRTSNYANYGWTYENDVEEDTSVGDFMGARKEIAKLAQGIVGLDGATDEAWIDLGWFSVDGDAARGELEKTPRARVAKLNPVDDTWVPLRVTAPGDATAGVALGIIGVASDEGRLDGAEIAVQIPGRQTGAAPPTTQELEDISLEYIAKWKETPVGTRHLILWLPQEIDVDLEQSTTFGDVIDRLETAGTAALGADRFSAAIEFVRDDDDNPESLVVRLSLNAPPLAFAATNANDATTAEQLKINATDADGDGVVEGGEIGANLDRERRLVDLNVTPTPAGNGDISITLRDGVVVDIDLSGSATLGDIIDRINATLDAKAPRPGLYRIEINDKKDGLDLIARLKTTYGSSSEPASIRGQIAEVAQRIENSAAREAARLFEKTQTLPGPFRGVFTGQGTVFTLDQIMGITDPETQPIDFLILEKPLRSFHVLLGDEVFEEVQGLTADPKYSNVYSLNTVEVNTLLDYRMPDLFFALSVPLSTDFWALVLSVFAGPEAMVAALANALTPSGLIFPEHNLHWEVEADFGFAYDNEGLEAYRDTRDPRLILNGFYLDDEDGIQPNPLDVSWLFGGDSAWYGTSSAHDPKNFTALIGIGFEWGYGLSMIAELGFEVVVYVGGTANLNDPNDDHQIRA